MAIGPRLDLRTSQTLVMTPQLQQAIRLLQMSSLEVTSYIEQEIEQNPLLERESGEGGFESGGESEKPWDDADRGPGPEATARDTAELTASGALLDSDPAAMDADFDNVWDAGSASDGGSALHWERSGGAPGSADGEPDLENLAEGATTLREHLLSQVAVDFGVPAERLIAAHLVEQLDESGYFTAEPAEVAVQLGCTGEQIEAVLARLRRLDPAGVFARSLADCLAMQLADQNRLDPYMQALLDNLELLARRDLAGLRRIIGCDAADLADMIAELRALNPRPASAFDRELVQPVIPDVLVRARSGGGWAIELNSDTLPRVLINKRYYALISKHVRSKREREYLTDRLHSANWLVKSLHQRAQTILKVATELVNQQEAFFIHGVAQLRPLTLREVAEVVGVHESTVSRVTNNKYIGSARGIFEMRYFFTTAVGHPGGDQHSAEAVRHRIKALIERESVDDVLSDDRIVEILHRDGVDVARRTVAKYRESLRIPSSVRRRRDKAMQM